MDFLIIQPYAVALGLGLLVGFQREWTKPNLAGIRTIAFITVFGTLAADVSRRAGAWVLAAGLIVVGAMLVVGTIARVAARKRVDRQEEEEIGLTTHAVALLMFLVGAGLIYLPLEVPVILGGVATLLLQWKEPLHGFIRRIGERDVRAIVQLVLVALVVLPVLPNEGYGPFGVLNPFEIWTIVVLICGISLGGYIVYRALGPRVGTLVGGMLGGVISSTATTVSYARRAGQGSHDANSAAVVIMIASTVVFGRVFVEVWFVAPDVVWTLAPPLSTTVALMLAVSGGLFWLLPGEEKTQQLDDDPSDLKSALVFGGLYALVLVVVALARQHFGDSALYAVAAVSGLTDMDAITLTAARFIDGGQISVDTGWRMILLGALSNLVFKGAVVAFLGGRRLFLRILVAFGITLAGGTLILLFWPEIPSR